MSAPGPAAGEGAGGAEEVAEQTVAPTEVDPPAPSPEHRRRVIDAYGATHEPGPEDGPREPGDTISEGSAAARPVPSDGPGREALTPQGVSRTDDQPAPPQSLEQAAGNPAQSQEEEPGVSDTGEPSEPQEGGDPATGWTGEMLQPYSVGDPGRAAIEVVPGLPAEPGDPADTLLDGGRRGTLSVRAASLRGTSHRHSGTPRQDDYAICTSANRWLIVAVGDGVSAGALSHQAATIACRTAAGAVGQALQLDPDLEAVPWADVLADAATRILAHGRRTLAGDDDGEVTGTQVARTMATTLLVLVLELDADESGRRCGRVLALGDTSAFRLTLDKRWEPLTAVKNEGSEIASSVTIALPYVPEEAPHASALTLDRGEALFVMTDGVGDPLGGGDGDVGEFLAEVWCDPPDMLLFGAQVGFARRTYDDDRTVVGIWAEL